MSKQKLELTWIGKNEKINIEPRILIENLEYSYGDVNTENMIIHGDNLLALKSLQQEYTGKIKCIYIDPPYNTGSAFEHYDDNLEHSIWLSLMKPRIELLKELLSEDGTIFIQVDDNEQAYIKIMCDEIFGRSNFLNCISVKMKQTAGASGGGEDKKLKKNIEYLLVYTKDNNKFNSFNSIYEETDLFELIEEMKENKKSWKYTRILDGIDDREFLLDTVDGSGEKIKIYKHQNIKYRTIKEIMKEENLTEKEAYLKYYDKIFRDTNSQSSIRTRVIEATEGMGNFFSIDYTPISGKNKNKLTTVYYKGNNRDQIAWLSDICKKRGNNLIKLEKLGTYWDGFPLNNLTKEGGVLFVKSKKPELLIKQIFDLATNENDLVLDSFLGSGTTIAVAHKMNRKYIGIEMGDHAYTHVVPRMKKVIDGEQSGISKSVNWNGGGGLKFYELASSLLEKDKFGNLVISKKYNAEMLAEAIAKHEGYTYSPDANLMWRQGYSGNNNYIFTTTESITEEYLNYIASELLTEEYLLICAKSYDKNCFDRYSNITIKQIPKALLGRCEFGKENYDLPIIEKVGAYNEE